MLSFPNRGIFAPGATPSLINKQVPPITINTTTTMMMHHHNYDDVDDDHDDDHDDHEHHDRHHEHHDRHHEHHDRHHEHHDRHHDNDHDNDNDDAAASSQQSFRLFITLLFVLPSFTSFQRVTYVAKNATDAPQQVTSEMSRLTSDV
jgi:hypothetical protein